ncbi:MAG: UDP-N-acetylglucosamine 1-carboxyvinyltransferase [Candidatus Zophobacter franzmannii]|nr:UDP-N-acetylglucosamine 1-carboxyvinyltransferase [Candidatus Zophobacter franzmannii]
MDKFIIRGGKKLSGEIKVSGAKNAVLPIMAATLLAGGRSVLTNVPKLNDIKSMAHLLRVIGARIEYTDDSLKIDAKDVCFAEAPYELVSKMRASVWVLGPLLARLGEAKVSFPGGCAIGTRPVDLHLMAMEKLGAVIEIKHGYIHAKAEKLIGADITFEKVSVGATINAMMAAVKAEGITNIYNAAIEPEVTATADFLNKMGGKITGVGTNHLVLEGVKELFPVGAEMIPDRIEAGTFLLAGAITKSKITVTNCIVEHVQSLIDKMKQAGCKFEIKGKSVTVIPAEHVKSVNMIANPYPAFPTDLQAQFLTYMCLSEGSCTVEDRVFPDRFMHVAELNRLQADIRIQNTVALINGVKSLSGAPVMATDLRASAALVLAGLAAEGETEIARIYHIDRGYDHIETKLKAIGADIERVSS